MRTIILPFLKTMLAIFVIVFIASCSQSSKDDNWLQYRNDAGRTGYTSHTISDNLSPAWIYNFGTPDKSWTGVHSRMIFDHAFHPVISGDKVCLGNSNDCKIYTLDRKSGEIIWTFCTDGPVRFAPAIWKDKLFAISDMGIYIVFR